MIETMLWRRLDAPGHDSARLFFHDSQWHLTGTAVFMEAQQPSRLDYRVVCDESWQTLGGSVTGWLGTRAISIELRADADHRWQLNETDCPDVADCIDLDFAFTPATNLLPIRRLRLPIGQAANVRAAWLTFPDLTLKPLDQAYRRKGLAVYAYESDGGRFSAELQVNAADFITVYPGLWMAVTPTAT